MPLMQMDWFERLTGFRETDYDDTRAKLRVEGRRLRSLINGKSYGIGELELVPLQTLREKVKSAGALPGQLKVNVVTGDVRQMHQACFAMASSPARVHNAYPFCIFHRASNG